MHTNSNRSFLLSLLLLCAFVADGRLISDGGGLLRLKPFVASCDQTYGFMPCTDTALGNLFLILVYGYLTSIGAANLTRGSEQLLEILGTGIIGGALLPVLIALPDAMLVLVSGLSGSTKTAQTQVSVGMGLLSGSTVLLLTVIWGTCVVVGKCDLQNSGAIKGKDTLGFSLTGSGIITDIWTAYAARIMAISVVPFLVVQLPQGMSSTSGSHSPALYALIVSLMLLIAYCIYQVSHPWLQRINLDYAKRKHVISGVLRHLRMRSLGRLHGDDGKPNEEVIRKLFKSIDGNDDGYITAPEMKAFIVAVRFEVNLDHDHALNHVMSDLDTSHDELIDFDEFVNGVSKWLGEAKCSGFDSRAGPDTIKYLDHFHQQTKREHARLGGQSLGDQRDDKVEGVEKPKWASIKAVLLLLLGILLAGAVADPLVDAVDNFSNAASTPPFFISFIVLPLASNSELVSEIILARQKSQQSASLTFSKLYALATMKNLLSLSVFLVLVYFRDLTWDFSIEVLVTFLVCLLIGAFASFRTTFPLWTSLVAFVLYPFSLALVYVLHYILGWS